MSPLLYLLSSIIWLINTALFCYVIISLLISFEILNRHQPIVSRIYYALHRLLDPLLRPIRNILPDLGGIDVSPIILILLLNFLEYTLAYYGRALL